MTDLGFDVLVWSLVYLALLVVLGARGHRARRERSLADHFLAGRSIGFPVLLLTLFATQYSGNSMSGFPGQTYREGVAYFMSVTFMVGIVSGYLLFAPALFDLSRRGRYLTPTDFLADRFRSPLLNGLSALIFTFTLGNFLLAQLMAMGHAFSGLTTGRVPYWAGVVGGGLVILVYELLGGLRAVAWTDVLQGSILLVGLTLVLALILVEVGSPAAILESVRTAAPEKIANPSAATCLMWVSNFLLLALGAPLYPQAIQRIYAARRRSELRRALAVMAVLPLFAITTVVLIGVTGITLFPALDRAGSEEITFRVLAWLVGENPAAYTPVLIVMLAVIAAIMSTVDSALLSLSSVLTKDVTARLRGLDEAGTEALTRVAPVISIAVMAVLVLLALFPWTTLWGLLVVKFEILIQLSPAFVLGTLRRRGDRRGVNGGEVLAGLVVGLGFVGLGRVTGIGPVGGLHPGTVGVAVNYATVWGLNRWRRRVVPAENAGAP